MSGPVALETEDFAGRILILNRPQPEPEEWTYKELFKGKQRHFQLRLQGRFKSEPSQDVFLSVETPNAIPCETMRKKAASLMMKLCSKLVELRGFEFYYNMDWKKFPDSDILRPHCTIPLRGADFLVQTPDGEEPPSIMSNMDTMPAAPKKAVSFNTRDTYTFAWWSKYVDLFAWRTSNFPMGLNGPLEQYVGREICASLFRLPLEEELKAMEADGLPPPNDWLCESQKLTFFRLKLTHSAMTEPAEAEFEDCVEWDDLEEDFDMNAWAETNLSPSHR